MLRYKPALLTTSDGGWRAAMTLFLAVLTTMTAWADDVTLTEDTGETAGTAARWYVNMPATGTNTLTLTDASITTFKVYDDGGKNGNYSDGCDGILVLTAPEDYVLQLSGNITTQGSVDYLKVYNGTTTNDTNLLYKVASPGYGTPTAIATVISSGTSMTLSFHSSSYTNYAGLDLTVTLISINTEYGITVSNSTTGCSVAASVGGNIVTNAKVNDVVTLTASPSTGYLLNDLSVVRDDNGAEVDITDMLWYTGAGTSTFTMPASAVTVTPTFTDDLTADGGLFINMPATGTETVTIPAGVQSFKVYDDGGKNGNYSNNCDGTLVLTAPEGYIIQLSGNIYTERTDMNSNTHVETPVDYLTVYDNSNATGAVLINKACNGRDNFNWIGISSVCSTGRSMTLCFYSNKEDNYCGLDLTVTLINTAKNITVNTVTGGNVVSDKQTAKEGETVTLTVTDIDDGYKLANISVTDADGNPVHVNCKGFMSSTATFQMPEGYATVTPTFTNTWTADGGLYINMPATGTVCVAIPEGVTSFKVYDDGGWDGNFSPGCDGTLVLTAPVGYILQLSGTVETWTPADCDYLSVYDNNEASGTLLIDKIHSTDGRFPEVVPTVSSSGQSLTCYFHSIDSENEYYFGLDLTVTLVNPNKEFDISVNTATGGTIESDNAKSTFGKTIKLTGTTETGYLLNDLSVVRDDNGAEVDITDMLWYTGTSTGTFQMPGSDVTVTPTFTDNLTADGGLYINMPTTGTKTAIIPEGVTSFKVYDDGGRDAGYSIICNGSLVLTAPEGYVLKLSGTITTDNISAYMAVYDNSEASGKALIGWANGYGQPTSVSTVWSTGRYMTIYFWNNSTVTYPGMDLTVTVIRNDTDYDIVLRNSTYGTIASDKAAYKQNETVKLTATSASGCLLSDLSVVTNTDGVVVPVTDMRWYTASNTATFQMPPDGVTVIPTFTNELTADGGLYINMFANEDKHIYIPKGVESFKVYDDGGRNGNYTTESVSNLELHAPEGCVLRLSGSITGFSGNPRPSYMNVYDTHGAMLIYNRKSENTGYPSDVPTVTSSGQSLRIYFNSGGNSTALAGLDLTVEVIYRYDFSLADNADNSEAVISAVESGEEHDVGLSGRTLYCDGSWNTLCLPFSVSDLSGTPLAAATIMELDTETETGVHRTGFCDGTLYLNFKRANSIEAGRPYIVKSGPVDAVIPYYRVFTGQDPWAGSTVYSTLLDGLASTDWLVFSGSVDKSWGCEFEILDPVIVTGYTMTSGSSVEEYPEWSPKEWYVKASRDWDEWSTMTVIDSRNVSQNADDAMPTTSGASKTYSIAPENQQYYKFFSFRFTDPSPVQLAELELHGKKDYLTNPVFNDVTLTSSAPIAVTSSDGKVTFRGTYSPVSINGEDRHKLYLGAENTLYYPNAAMTIGSCRAYFQLNDLTAGDPTAGVRAFVLKFEEDETDGIWEIKNEKLKIKNEDGGWYDLSGRKLDGKPTQQGIYIHNGRKKVMWEKEW